MALNEDKINFCIRYLSHNGINSLQYDTLLNSIALKPVVEFDMVRQDDSFFSQVAKGLRDLWPPGNKDGKWAWRESVPVLTERLKFIWRQQKVTDDYSVDDILEAGRKYLARFEHENTKYMVLLKYFIFKQKTVGVEENGMYKMSYESPLLNLLKDKKDETVFDEMNTEFNLV